MGLPARKMDRRYTYRDYREWPDDERWELIDGVAYNMSPAPNLNHQGLLVELGHQIRSQLEGKPCRVFFAPVDVFLPADPAADEDDVDTVVQPDLLVVCGPSQLRPKGIWGAPDFVIEILSPWTQKKDLAEKFEAYQRSGVREYWILDPGNRSLVVYRLTRTASGEPRYADGEVHTESRSVGCGSIDGLVIDLQKVFAALLP